MKLLTVLFICVSYLTYGQDGPPPTTEEEYAYLTKGYKVQTESGLDMKKGYKFAESEVIPVGNYSFEVKSLIREAKNELAGILVISKSKISGNTYYVAIPMGNPDLMSKYYSVLDSWDSSILSAYSYVISSYFAAASRQAHELQKTK